MSTRESNLLWYQRELEDSSALSWDGTSQAGRALAALEPESAKVDERTTVDLLRFARAHAQRLSYYGEDGQADGDWSAFLTGPVSDDDVVAYMRDPTRFRGAELRWLSRPHFALFLTFLEQLELARNRVNRFTRRHLEHYYEHVLRMQRQAPEPDRVAVLFAPRAGVERVKLDKGTQLNGGKDSAGKLRVYETERDLVVSRARIEEVRSVYVDRQVAELEDLHRGGPQPERLMGMLALAVGRPRLGGKIPKHEWSGEKGVDVDLLTSLVPLLDFAWQEWGLHFHELREIVRLKRRRDEGRGWAQIYDYLGLDQTDGRRNLAEIVEALGRTPKYDGLTNVTDLDDLYDELRATNESAQPERWQELAGAVNDDLNMSVEDFLGMMEVKRRIDGEWARVYHLLAQAGQRVRGELSYEPAFADPSRFEGNFAAVYTRATARLELTHEDEEWVFDEVILDAAVATMFQAEVGGARHVIRVEIVVLGPGGYAVKIEHRIDDRPSPDIGTDSVLIRPGITAELGQGNLRLTLTRKRDVEWPSWSKDGVKLYRLYRVEQYQELLDSFRPVLHVRAEGLQVLANATKLDEPSWSGVRDVLAAAHREMIYSERRKLLEEARGDLLEEARGPGKDVEELEQVTRVAMRQEGDPQVDGQPDGSHKELSWSEMLARLRQHLSPGQVSTLELFHSELAAGLDFQRVSWEDAFRLLELAQRNLEALPEPVARKVDWRNLYARRDARSATVDEGSPRWRPFGAVPHEWQENPAPRIGWGIRSPLLQLSSGTRTITLTFGLPPEGQEPEGREKALTRLETEIEEEAALVAQVSTEKGWVEVPLSKVEGAVDGFERETGNIDSLCLEVTCGPELDAIAPLAPAEGKVADAFPSLRLMLRQRPRGPDSDRHLTIAYEAFASVRLAAVRLHVDVKDLREPTLQSEDRRLDPNKPFEPFGSRPLPGARFYLGHAELVHKRLSSLTLKIAWAGLPEGELSEYYAAYPRELGEFGASIGMVEDGVDLFALGVEDLGGTTALFPTVKKTLKPTTLAAHPRRLDGRVSGDVRRWTRHWYVQLDSSLGHAEYVRVAGSAARKLAVALAVRNPPSKVDLEGDPPSNVDPTVYAVNPPYTPAVQRLTIDYSSVEEVDLDKLAEPNTAPVDEVFHVLPFGTQPIHPDAHPDSASPRLMPAFDHPGELYLGISGLRPPQQLSLLFQMADGTSDPDKEPGEIEWSYLSGRRWHSLREGRLRLDTTRGLINSGIVEFDLPAAERSPVLGSDSYWLRARVPAGASTRSVADAIDVHTQAVSAVFVDRDNAADHYEHPLEGEQIKRLLRPNAKIGSVRQPYAAYGSRPAEQAAGFYTRVSERLRHKRRAISPWDYERLVLARFPHLYKVKCLPAALHGSAGVLGRVDLVVIPDIRHPSPHDRLAPKAPMHLLAEIQQYVAQLCPTAADVRVRNAHYVQVRVKLAVRFAPGEDEGNSIRRLNEDLNRHLSPWAHDAGADLVIGGRIYANSLVDYVDRLDYVDYLAPIRFAKSEDGGEGFKVVPEEPHDHHVRAEAPDQVLVSAREHQIDVITEAGYDAEAFAGIGHMRIKLDFIVAPNPTP